MPRMGDFVIDATWAALCSLTTMRIRRISQTADSHLCHSAGSFDRHIKLLSNRLTLRQDRFLFLRGVDWPYGSHMDRALIVSYLQAAEERIKNGEQDIAAQRDLISALERTGHEGTGAIAQLLVMEQTQIQHVAERDRLRDELAVLSAAQLGNRRRTRRTPDQRR